VDLADDPSFLADLEELDRGLTVSRAPRRVARPFPSEPAPTAAARAPVSVARPAPAPPSSLTPFAPRSAADAPIVLQPGSRRPLLDLFPPEASADRLSPPLLRGTTPAPQLARPLRVAPRADEATPGAEPRSDQTFYGFAEAPFALEPDLKFLYHSVEHDRVVQQIVQAIARRDAVSILTGPTGIGKTLACKAIPEQLDRRAMTSIVLTPVASFDDLVQRLLADFGVLSREELATRAAAGAGALVDTLRSFLGPLASLRANAVIVIDEAQNVAPDVLTALDELAASMPSTVQIVLAGQPSLERLIARPELRALNQRGGERVQLGVLAADEVPGYVMHRIHVAAAGPRIDFDDAALALVYDVSGGVPRIVNQVCDRALMRASQTAQTLVTAEIVTAAADDLGMSPPAAAVGLIRIVGIMLALVLLAVAGAGVSAWVFRDRMHRIVVQWQGTPDVPAAPSLPRSTPLAPPAEPR